VNERIYLEQKDRSRFILEPGSFVLSFWAVRCSSELVMNGEPRVPVLLQSLLFAGRTVNQRIVGYSITTLVKKVTRDNKIQHEQGEEYLLLCGRRGKQQ
jgi:hypothetical protein